MKHSTTKPTKEEAAYIVAVKDAMLCMACEGLRAIDMGGCDMDGVEFHHLLQSGRRRGHMFGLGLCQHHHRAVPLEGITPKQMRVLFGPSLMDGSKKFAEVFGDDETLLRRQREILGMSDA